jgi:hypothetical protein
MTKFKGLIVYQLFREEHMENELVTPLNLIMKSHRTRDASLGVLRILFASKNNGKVPASETINRCANCLDWIDSCNTNGWSQQPTSYPTGQCTHFERSMKIQPKLCFLHARYCSPFYFKPTNMQNINVFVKMVGHKS